MGKIILDISMSLDGFIAGPGINREQPMGKDGPRLHQWLFENKTDTDTRILSELVGSSGAVITGNHTYTTAIDDAWEGVSPFIVPAFVICHTVPATVPEGFTFITDGIESALTEAKKAAGDKNVWVMGGANIIRQYIEARLFDELHIHIVPVIFSEGTRLFENTGAGPLELQKLRVTDTPAATHIQYRLVN